ncbi:MAG: hypothetical protein EXR79_01810 [Myxococcales bacterium]|nr:hypothetical protein [Myxococcales bacterium]
MPDDALHLRIRAVALLLAASSGLSRVLGYGRDWLLNTQFGATGQTDVYQASFTVPDMLNYLLAGGALSIAFLPRIAALFAADAQQARPTAEGESGAADRAFSIVFTAMAALAAVFVVGCELAAEPLVRMLVPGFDEERTAQTVTLTRIALPAQWFFLLGGLVQSTLLARQSFRALALTPLLYNVAIIVGGWIGSRTGHIEGFSIGAVVGAALGGFVVPVLAARGRLQFTPTWRPLDPEVRSFLWRALPLMVGVSLTTVDEWLGRAFGSHFEPGAISHLGVARRLMLVPIALFGTAAAQATGAYLARLHAENDRARMAELLATTVAAVVSLSLAASALALAVPEPAIALLFEYGRFGRADTVAVAGALQPLALGIAAWGAQSVLARAFFATGDTWRPMVATSCVTLLMLPVYALLARHHIAGLGLAATIGIAAQACALGWLAQRRLGFDVARFGAGAARALGVSLLAGLAASAVDQVVAGALDPELAPFLRHLLRLGAAVSAWAVIVAVVGARVGMPGLPARISALALGRSPGAGPPEDKV